MQQHHRRILELETPHSVLPQLDSLVVPFQNIAALQPGQRIKSPVWCLRHRARVTSSPSLGRNEILHLHRMHCASWCLCIFLAFIGQERARPAASHALCDIVPVFLLAFIGQERARASAYHALCPATVVRTTLAGDAVLHPCCSGRRADAWRMAYARREMVGAATWLPRRRPGRPRGPDAAAS